MMQKCILFFFLAMIGAVQMAGAQRYDTAALLQSRRYTAVGDYDNALLLLKKLYDASPANASLAGEYVMVSFLRHDYTTAMKVGEPMLTTPAADAALYQTMAGVYEGIGQDKKMVATYESGIARFPKAGKLYAALGAHYASKKKNADAIRTWESGITNAPAIADNYYYAVKYYSTQQPNAFKVILYAENFILTDRLSSRTTEAKELLLNAYNQFFTQNVPQPNSEFGRRVAAWWLQNKALLSTGFTAENYGNLRKAFLADWKAKGQDSTYPYTLFAYQQKLIDLQLFDAYNQWLLAATPRSLSRYQEEQKTNWDAFITWFKKDIYKVTAQQSL